MASEPTSNIAADNAGPGDLVNPAHGPRVCIVRRAIFISIRGSPSSAPSSRMRILDHARRFGHRHYLASRAGANVLLSRLPDISLQTLAYGERLDINGVTVSLHPAGHVLGSGAIAHRIRWPRVGSHRATTCWTPTDLRCIRARALRIHSITESTLRSADLPMGHAANRVRRNLSSWWRHNAAQGGARRCCSAGLFGKAKRVLASVDAGIGPILLSWRGRAAQ